MKRSIALITGATSELCYAAARTLTGGGRREIVTGRSLAWVHETAAQVAAETKRQIFTPLELVKRGRPINFLLLNAGMVPGKKRVLTAAGVEAAQT